MSPPSRDSPSTTFEGLALGPSAVTSNQKSIDYKAFGVIGLSPRMLCRRRDGGPFASGRGPKALVQAQPLDPLVVARPAFSPGPVCSTLPPPPGGLFAKRPQERSQLYLVGVLTHAPLRVPYTGGRWTNGGRAKLAVIHVSATRSAGGRRA
jgi:hypothetical protein